MLRFLGTFVFWLGVLTLAQAQNVSYVSRMCSLKSPCPGSQVCLGGRCIPSHPTVTKIQKAMKAGFLKYDLKGYLAPWSSKATILMHQKLRDTPTVTLTAKQNAELKRIRFRGPNSYKSMTHRNIHLKILGNKAVLQWEFKLGWLGGYEIDGERYILTRTREGWKILENRIWPVERRLTFTYVRYTSRYFQIQTRKAVAFERADSWKNAIFTWWDIWKFGEAYRVMKEVTRKHPNFRPGWLWLGFTALYVGKTRESLGAFHKAWHMAPHKPLPPFIRGLVENKHHLHAPAKPTAKPPTSRPTSRPAKRP